MKFIRDEEELPAWFRSMCKEESVVTVRQAISLIARVKERQRIFLVLLENIETQLLKNLDPEVQLTRQQKLTKDRLGVPGPKENKYDTD